MGASRYVDDVPYVRSFISELSPAWIDFAALLWGFAPVDRQGGFAWCDLGCGQGVNAVVLAASHPNGRFHGVDFLPEHVDNARALAKAANAGNATFHAADFGAAAELDLPAFDYITAHGVYSWVDDQARSDLRRFVDRHLKPGGRFYVSYNALPGRAPDMPFQRLMLELGERFSGDSAQRVRQAAAFASRLKAVNTAALTASPMAELLLSKNKRFNASYMAHELMGANWRPLSVLEVRAHMAQIDLEPAGSAVLLDNFDDFILCKAARKLLDQVYDPDLKALVRDYLVNQSFRRDVFIKEGTAIDAKTRQRLLLSAPFALAQPRSDVKYKLQTPAGEIAFDNPIARHMVRVLANGPRRLGDLATASIGNDDLIANAMVLASAQQIWPVELGDGDVRAFNKVVMNRLGGPEELRMLALPSGTAIQLDRDVLAGFRNSQTAGRGRFARWADYLEHQGVADLATAP